MHKQGNVTCRIHQSSDSNNLYNCLIPTKIRQAVSETATLQVEHREKDSGCENRRQSRGCRSRQCHSTAVLGVVRPCVCGATTGVPTAALSRAACHAPDLPGSLYPLPLGFCKVKGGNSCFCKRFCFMTIKKLESKEEMDAHKIPTMLMRPQMMMSCILLGHGASRRCCTPYAMGSKGEEEDEGESAFPHLGD